MGWNPLSESEVFQDRPASVSLVGITHRYSVQCAVLGGKCNCT